MPETIIEVDEPSGRIAMWLRANPGKHLDRAAAAGRLQIAIGAVDPQLMPGVEAGLLTVFTDGEFGRGWRAGPRLAHWQPDALRTAAKATAAHAPAPSKPKRARVSMPPLDVSKLPTVSGPPPVGRADAIKGTTKHDAVFDSLTADNMGRTGIPKAYLGALMKAAQTYLAFRPDIKAKSVLVVRVTGNSTCGVWRMPRPAGAAAQTCQTCGGKGKYRKPYGRDLTNCPDCLTRPTSTASATTCA